MFKYSPRQYNTLLTLMGCVRIGTLYDFRQTEHKRGIADPQEGIKRVHHSFKDLVIPDVNDPRMMENKDFRALKEFRIADMQAGINVRFGQVNAEMTVIAPDRFIYCLSGKKDAHLYREFEGSDSCVQVTNPKGFFDALTASLNSIVAVKFTGIHEVSYRVRDENWNGSDWGEDSVLWKEPRFSRQAELRAIWVPLCAKPIKPVVVGNAGLLKYCQPVEL